MMSSTNAQTAYYLLGFSAHSSSDKPVAVPTLLRQLQIEHFTLPGITAWYRAVSRHDFEGPLGQRNLADLNWLTPRVLAHESVVAKLNELGEFYPARFGCLFSRLEILTSFAEHNRDIVSNFFQQARGRQEWGLKFSIDLDSATQAAALRAEQSELGKLSGAAYLKFKQAQRTMKGPVLRQLQDAVDQRITQLREKFSHIVLRPTRSLAQPDRETLLANVALWLRLEEVNQLNATCEQWRSDAVEPAIQIAVSGPWPAYSFCPSLCESPAQAKAA